VTATGAAAGTGSSANGALRVVIPLRASPFTLSPQILERTKKQLPLQPGRKVAFRVPSGNDKAGYEEGGWILATIKKEEKNHQR
jgi:hypothetical protein